MTLCVVLQEAVSDTLEELWISYNNIEKMKGITSLGNLKVRHNAFYYTTYLDQDIHFMSTHIQTKKV